MMTAESTVNNKTSAWRALTGIIRLELKRVLRGKRSIPMYLLVSVPILLLIIRISLHIWKSKTVPVSDAQHFTSVMFYFLVLRVVVFFSCLLLFNKLFKGEMADRTMHHYFLLPVKRNVITMGKFISGFIISFGLISTMFIIFYVLSFAEVDLKTIMNQMHDNHIIPHLGWYLLIICLACLSYGTIFCLFSAIHKNPEVLGIFFMLWEIMSTFLPVKLKYITVIFYLQSLMPIEVIPDSPFAVLGDPAPVWRCILTCGVLALTFLIFSTMLWKNKEIRYATEN